MIIFSPLPHHLLMEDPYNCSRPYIPTQPYSPVDPLGNAHYDHIKDGAPANPELGYDQPPLIVTANESVDLFQDPHGWSQRACTTPVPHPEATYRPPRDSLHEPLPSIDQAKPDPLDHAQFALNPSSSCDRAVEGYIHNPMRTDCAENRSDDERQLVSAKNSRKICTPFLLQSSNYVHAHVMIRLNHVNVFILFCFYGKPFYLRSSVSFHTEDECRAHR